jgi:hypothetical protein
MSIRKIEQNIGDVPVYGESLFEEKTYASFISLKEIIPKIDITIGDIDLTVAEMNVIKSYIDAKKVTVDSAMVQSISSASSALDSKTKAEAAFTKTDNLIRAYVIPTNATLSESAITQKIRMSQILNITGA